MSSKTAVILGEKEMKVLFDKLSKKSLDKKAAVWVFRKVARPLIRLMRANAPVSKKKMWYSAHRHTSKGVRMTKLKIHRPGELKRSIGIVIGRYKTPIAWIGPRFGAKAVGDNDPYYAAMVESGQAGRSGMSNEGVGYLRKSWDMDRQRSEKALGDEFEDHINKWIDKYGPKYF